MESHRFRFVWLREMPFSLVTYSTFIVWLLSVGWLDSFAGERQTRRFWAMLVHFNQVRICQPCIALQCIAWTFAYANVPYSSHEYGHIYYLVGNAKSNSLNWIIWLVMRSCHTGRLRHGLGWSTHVLNKGHRNAYRPGKATNREIERDRGTLISYRAKDEQDSQVSCGQTFCRQINADWRAWENHWAVWNTRPLICGHRRNILKSFFNGLVKITENQ